MMFLCCVHYGTFFKKKNGFIYKVKSNAKARYLKIAQNADRILSFQSDDL